MRFQGGERFLVEKGRVRALSHALCRRRSYLTQQRAALHIRDFMHAVLIIAHLVVDVIKRTLLAEFLNLLKVYQTLLSWGVQLNGRPNLNLCANVHHVVEKRVLDGRCCRNSQLRVLVQKELEQVQRMLS